MADAPTPLVNKTLRAVITGAVMVFNLSVIIYLIRFGVAHNSLHESAMSWSYTVLLVSMAAMGLDSSITAVLGLVKPNAPTSNPPT